MRIVTWIKREKGYTFVEIMIVVIIIGMLASISVPMLLTHRRKAVATEAAATMGLVRQAIRDYWINHNTYYDVGSGNIKNGYPSSVPAGVPTPSTAGVDVDVGVTQYFSNAAFSVDGTTPASARFVNPGPVDFLIVMNGGASVACSSSVLTDCAIHAVAITNIDMEMDNSGRMYISYDNGSTWQEY